VTFFGRGQDDQSIVAPLEASGDDPSAALRTGLGEDVGGGLVCGALFGAVALGEGEEGFAGGGAFGQEGAHLGELAGAQAVPSAAP